MSYRTAQKKLELYDEIRTIRNLDTVWRNRDEAVETNGTSYAGNYCVALIHSGNAKSLYHRKTKPQ